MMPKLMINRKNIFRFQVQAQMCKKEKLFIPQRIANMNGRPILSTYLIPPRKQNAPEMQTVRLLISWRHRIQWSERGRQAVTMVTGGGTRHISMTSDLWPLLLPPPDAIVELSWVGLRGCGIFLSPYQLVRGEVYFIRGANIRKTPGWSQYFVCANMCNSVESVCVNARRSNQEMEDFCALFVLDID